MRTDARTGIVAIGVVLLIGLTACGFPALRDQTRCEVAEGRWHVDPAQVPPSGSGPSQTIEFRDAAGRNVGYGRVQGGTVNIYGPDGSRVGYGRR